MVRDLVLVDSQPARIRVFREAIAVYQHRFARRSAEKESDFAAAKAARRRLAQEGEGVRLHVFPSGQEALKFLRQEPPYEWAPRPAVVFTELYAACESGVALVQQLKADPELQSLPTVVLCSGASAVQVHEAWEAGSNAVVSLPLELPGILSRVADTLEFWLKGDAV